jgi:hypothetical protein
MIGCPDRRRHAHLCLIRGGCPVQFWVVLFGTENAADLAQGGPFGGRCLPNCLPPFCQVANTFGSRKMINRNNFRIIWQGVCHAAARCHSPTADWGPICQLRQSLSCQIPGPVGTTSRGRSRIFSGRPSTTQPMFAFIIGPDARKGSCPFVSLDADSRQQREEQELTLPNWRATDMNRQAPAA